jgi:hypothetical protein
MHSPTHNRINDSEKSEIGISACDDDSKKPEEFLQVLPCLPTEETLDDFPDGGFRAWLVLFGVCLSLPHLRCSLTIKLSSGFLHLFLDVRIPSLVNSANN